MRRLDSVQDLLKATDYDVYVRGSLRRAFVSGWTNDDATAWIGIDAHEQLPYVCVLGEASAGASLLSSIRSEVLSTESRVTVLRAIGDELGEVGLRLADSEEWEFRWTSSVPETSLDVRWTEDLVSVEAFLDQHSPTASSRPGAAHVRRWAGAFDDTELVAVAADTTGVEGNGHLSSIATDTTRRGQGWGAAITSWITQQLLAEGCEVVTLGVFGTNDTAIRLYQRLGFLHVHQFRSGTLVAI